MLRGLSRAVCTISVHVLFLGIMPLYSVAQVNVLTQHNDIARTGQNLSETILTPANVSSGNFGKLFSVTVDGQIYAQPLYVSALSIPGAGTHNVVFVETMHDSVYALDADSGVQLWQITLLDAAHGATSGATTDPTGDTGCTELNGTEFGIISTPVIDPVAGIIYVVGKTVENNYPLYRLHALSLLTGAEMPNSPVVLTASVAGTGVGSSGGVLSFDPKYENQRPGLLLLNGIVYIGFGSYCDIGDWHGWIMAYNTASLKQTSAFTTTPNSEGSGVWLSGTGLAADLPAGSTYGRMFLATGNGTYDATTPYGTNNMDYGVDVVRLDLTNGVMNVTDAFTPSDQATLNPDDQDLAAGGIMLLPDSVLSGHPHQLLAAGKTGNIYLVDRDSLGGYSSTTNNSNIIEYIAPNQIGGVFGAPAYWNGHVYYWGDEDTLKQFLFDGTGKFEGYHLLNSTESAHFPGSTPAVSANGNSSGIVWDIDGSAYVGSAFTAGSSILYAHDALNVSTTLFSSAANPTRDAAGPAVKMAVPTIANGKVYAGTYGEVDVYGLLNADFALSASPANVNVQAGGNVTDTITVSPIAGFTGSVSLSASGLPTGLTVAFSAGTATGTTSATFTAASSTASGSYAIVITGTSGSLSHTVSVNVNVGTTPQASFTLSASPASLSLVQGQSSNSNISVTAVNGFSASVSLSVSGLPAGVSASFGGASSGVSVLTLATTAGATPGSYAIAVTGNSTSVTANTSIQLTISAVAQKTAQSISFNALPTETAGTTAALVASASSGLPITFASSTPSVCTVSGSTASLLSAGTCTISASQVGNTTYAAATTVNQSFAVTAANPRYTISASSASVTVTPPFCFFYCSGGASATDKISLSPVNGFNNTVTFSVTGLPSGVTATFSPTSLSTSGVTTLTLTPSSRTSRNGQTTITIYGLAAGGTSETASSLTVTLKY